MPLAPHFNDPQHWLNRAEESRVLAEQMSDETAKGMMLRIADDYRSCRKSICTPHRDGELHAMWETTSVRYYYAGPENGSHRAHRPMRVRQHILDDIEGRVCAGRGNQVASFSLLGKAAKRTSIMDIDIAELFYLGLASTGLLALVLRLAFW